MRLAPTLLISRKIGLDFAKAKAVRFEVALEALGLMGSLECIQIWGQPHISARIPASLAPHPSWRTAPMKMIVQFVVCEDDGREETITDVVILERTCQQLEQVGLTLAEAKTLLQRLQQHLVERQAAAFVATRAHCQACGTLLSTKGHHALTFRTLFGTISLTSPRLCHCPCTPHETATFSPLTALLPEHTAPKLLFMETKWASLVSYGLTVQALTDFLPVDETLSVSTVRSNALAVA
jgi:hypothetical protein